MRPAAPHELRGQGASPFCAGSSQNTHATSVRMEGELGPPSSPPTAFVMPRRGTKAQQGEEGGRRRDAPLDTLRRTGVPKLPSKMCNHLEYFSDLNPGIQADHL